MSSKKCKIRRFTCVIQIFLVTLRANREVDFVGNYFFMETIYFAGGCFWGTEHFFQQIKGVERTQTGFANGNEDLPEPTYEEVYTDKTGYAETVKVEFDREQVSLEFLVRLFFRAIDPLSLNQQGHDIGTRYRTGVYYVSEEQKPVIEAVFAEEQKKYSEPMQVELLPLKNYYPADEYHQQYLDKHPDGYCHLPMELFRWAKEQRMQS